MLSATRPFATIVNTLFEYRCGLKRRRVDDRRRVTQDHIGLQFEGFFSSPLGFTSSVRRDSRQFVTVPTPMVFMIVPFTAPDRFTLKVSVVSPTVFVLTDTANVLVV